MFSIMGIMWLLFEQTHLRLQVSVLRRYQEGAPRFCLIVNSWYWWVLWFVQCTIYSVPVFSGHILTDSKWTNSEDVDFSKTFIMVTKFNCPSRLIIHPTLPHSLFWHTYLMNGGTDHGPRTFRASGPPLSGEKVLLSVPIMTEIKSP